MNHDDLLPLNMPDFNHPDMDEYLRRNLQVGRVEGARHAARFILAEVEGLKRPPPKWLMDRVQFIAEALDAGVVKDMVAYRQQVSPYPSERKPDPFHKD